MLRSPALPLLILSLAATAGEARSALPPLDADFQRALGKLVDARAKARKILIDDERYPVPAKAFAGWRVGIDQQPGHRDMEALVCAAIVKHNEVTVALAKLLRVPTRTVGLKRPTEKPLEVTRAVNHYGIVVVDLGIERFLKKASTSDGLDALSVAIRALAAEEWAAARTASGKLKGTDAVVWRLVRDATVLAWNERKRARHSRDEQDGMRVLNAYRAALGFRPLILDRSLHAMARDFAVEMAKGRFLSHQHPTDPTRRTLGRRAQRVRYKGEVGENVSSERDGAKAVWRWRADAGHHRLMVMQGFRAGGLGCTKVSVLNVGETTKAEIVALYP